MQKKKKTIDKASIKYDFGSIMWQGVELDKLKNHLIDHIDLISQYPERSAETICRLLSRRLDVAENELLVTDGGTGAIHLIARTLKEGTALIMKPSHSEFPHALKSAKHQVKVVDSDCNLTDISFEGVNTCWLCTPNAPNGRMWSRKSLLEMIAAHPNVLFIVDLSMISYVLEDTLKSADIKKYSNLIVISSFSKAYNVPGLRVGYIVADKKIISMLRETYSPRCVSTISMEAIRFILVHPAQFTLPIRKWLRAAEELKTAFSAIDGLEVVSSATPFFIVKLHKGTAKALSDFLLNQYSIKIGTKADDIQLAENEIRVCAQDKSEANQLFIDAVKEWAMS